MQQKDPEDSHPHSESGFDSERQLREATANTSALIVLQFFSRILTFSLNTAIVRLTAPAVLGIATLKLELFHDTVLFLAREGLRMALLRYTPHSEPKTWLRSLFHMSLLALPCGLPVIAFFLVAFHHAIPQEIAQAGLVARFWTSILVYAATASLDLLLEPFYMLCVHRNLLKARLAVESVALTARAAAVLFIFWSCSGGEGGEGEGPSLAHDLSLGLIAFPAGQIVHQLFVAAGLYRLFRRAYPNVHVVQLVPYGSIQIDQAILQHALDMTKQVFLRHLLSKGDMWIISLVAPLQDQGIYSVVTNYGSLLCRLLLHPVEEVALSFFSQTISDEALVRLASANSLPQDQRRSQIFSQRASALRYLMIVIKAHQLLSLFAIAFGVFLAKPLLGTTLGVRWPEAAVSLSLSTYCFLIPVMAFSGILETFVHATLTRPSIKSYQTYSVLSSILYIVLSVALTKAWGPVGLLLGNIGNFAARSIYGCYYLLWYVRRHELVDSYKTHLASLRLRPALYVAFATAATINALSHWILWPASLLSPHTIVMVSTLLATIFFLFTTEAPFLLLLKTMYVDRKTPKTKN